MLNVSGFSPNRQRSAFPPRDRRVAVVDSGISFSKNAVAAWIVAGAIGVGAMGIVSSVKGDATQADVARPATHWSAHRGEPAWDDEDARDWRMVPVEPGVGIRIAEDPTS
jgi:hypothetical protein